MIEALSSLTLSELGAWVALILGTLAAMLAFAVAARETLRGQYLP
jgi:hypothetical protein